MYAHVSGFAIKLDREGVPKQEGTAHNAATLTTILYMVICKL
jgi:hypothetical protein